MHWMVQLEKIHNLDCRSLTLEFSEVMPLLTDQSWSLKKEDAKLADPTGAP